MEEKFQKKNNANKTSSSIISVYSPKEHHYVKLNSYKNTHKWRKGNFSYNLNKGLMVYCFNVLNLNIPTYFKLKYM